MRQLLVLLFVASSAFAQTTACGDAKNQSLCTGLLAIEKRDQSARTAAMAGPQNFTLMTAMNKATTSSKPARPKKTTTLVARVWRGRVPTSRAGEYAKYLYDNGPVKIRAITGNLGAEMLRSENGDVTEFMVISYWPDRESIKAFAGADITKARFLPRDREFLINPDEFVMHYDVTSAP